jgi:4-hydroxy-2-oxoheptanedioate aldolase
MTTKWTGGAGIGTWIQSPNPEACEAAAGLGYDFCIIDMEHGTFGWDTAVHLVRATQLLGGCAIVRVLKGEPWTLQKALDLGADGIMVPKVETAEQAAEIVAACRFPGDGEGTRGACGTTRMNMHGARNFHASARRSSELHVWGLVETAKGLENLEAIAKSGLSGIVMGPFDLAFSLGFNGDTSRPEVMEAQKAVMNAAEAAKCECVVLLNNTDPVELKSEMKKWRDLGAKTFAAPSDRAMLTDAFSRALSACRSVL